LTFDSNRSGHVHVVQFQGTVHTAVAQCEARILEANKSGHRNLCTRGYPPVRAPCGRWFDSGRERRADAGSPVDVAEPAYFKIRERYKVRQVISAPGKSLGVDR